MIEQLKARIDSQKQACDTQVFGKLDAQFVEEIDRVADQMLMPRSWVVTQILKQWVERRQLQTHVCEDSWNGSYREVLATIGEDECIDPGIQIHAA